MNKVSITSDNNNNLVINNSIVAETLEVNQINVMDDVYVNSFIYTPVGSILTYAGVASPNGWLLCDGREVSKTTYPRLFAIIGNLYGTPVNNTNFVLPNLVDRVPVGKKNDNSVGNSGGNSSITLSVSQLPSHTHTGTSDVSGAHNHTGTSDLSGAHNHTGTSGLSGSHNHTINDPGHTHSQTTINDDFNNSGGNPPGFTGDSAGSRTWNNISTAYTGISVNSDGSHSHTFTTSNSDNHSHTFTTSDSDNHSHTFTTSNSNNHAHTFTTSNSNNHAHTFTTSNSNNHAHTFTTASTGSGNQIDIRNKFLIINYIIRY